MTKHMAKHWTAHRTAQRTEHRIEHRTAHRTEHRLEHRTAHPTKILAYLSGLRQAKAILLASLVAMHAAGPAQAQDAARVLSRTANLQQVLVPSSYCAQRLTVPAAPVSSTERSNTGAIVGAIAGGLLGSTVGRGDGRVAAAAIGAATGAIIGDRVDNTPASSGGHLGTAAPISQAGDAQAFAAPAVTAVPAPVASSGHVAPSGPLPAAPAIICQGSQALETRVSGYTVVYEYAGRQYSAQLNRDPGESLPLVITPDPSYLMPAPITSYAPIDQRRRRY